MIADTKQQIDLYQLVTRISAIKLEGKGIKFRGGSILAHCKRTYGLRGTREKVLEQMVELKKKLLS